jgi:hypothetical protein
LDSLQQNQPDLGEDERGCYHIHDSETGWVRGDCLIRDPMLTIMNDRRRNVHLIISQELVTALLQQVTLWKADGITPFAFLPPIDAPIEPDDAANARYLNSDLRDQFTAAGGVWLDIDPQGYETYDGSHLVPSSAIKLSRELAWQIEQYYRAAGRYQNP